jgi:hypothetical protein
MKHRKGAGAASRTVTKPKPEKFAKQHGKVPETRDIIEAATKG